MEQGLGPQIGSSCLMVMQALSCARSVKLETVVLYGFIAAGAMDGRATGLFQPFLLHGFMSTSVLLMY